MCGSERSGFLRWDGLVFFSFILFSPPSTFKIMRGPSSAITVQSSLGQRKAERVALALRIMAD